MNEPFRNSKKPYLWIIGAVFGLFITLLLLLPSILSTEWGKNQILSFLNNRLNGRVEIEALNVTWFSGQQLSGVVVLAEDNTVIAKVEKAQTESSLIPLIFGHIAGKTSINNLQVEVIPYADGTTNIDYLLKKTSAPSSASKLPAIVLHDVQSEGGSSPTLNLHLTGKTSVDARPGSFTVDIVTLQDSGDIKVDANVTQFPVLVLDQLASLKNPNLKGTLLAMLGDTLNINISQVLENNKSTKALSIYKMLLDIASDRAHISLQSTPNESEKQIALEFNVQGIRSTPLLLSVDKNVSLVNPTTVEIELSQDLLQKLTNQQSPIHWQARSPAQVTVQEFNSKYPEIDVLATSLQAAFEVENVVLFNLPGVGDVEILQATLESQAPELRDSHFRLRAAIQVLNPKGVLANFANEPLNIDLQGNLHLEDDGQPSVSNIAMNITNNRLTLDFKGSVSADKKLIMTEPATLTLSTDVTKLILTVAPIDLSLLKPEVNTLQATLSSAVQPDNLINIEWNRHKHSIVASGVFEGFQIGQLSPEVEAFFGASLNGSLKIQIKDNAKGPVFLSLKGTNGSLELDARYDNGVLLLNKPLAGSVIANERMAQTILKKAMPLLAGLISADNPINFQVEADGFSLPVYPFALEKTSISLATIDFGNMQFRNAGSLGKVLSVLKPGKNQFLSLWFTPLYLHFNKGILNVERVDLLLQGAYPIAAWGNVDLINERVDMQIGLSSRTIAHAFNVQIGNPNAYIAVPLQGSLNDPSLDKASATAQITALVAQNQAGAPGMILGTVLQIASGTASLTANIPPPTTDPLPWDGQLMDESQEFSSPVNVPIKAVSEGAGKLLKKFFN